MPIYYMELEALQIMITVSEKILFFNKSRTFFIQIFLFRFSEIVALVSLSTTFFLFIHTRDLNIRLAENAQFEASVSGSASAIGQGESSLNKDRRIEAERMADLELYGKVGH